MKTPCLHLFVVALSCSTSSMAAEAWSRFLGPNGSGVSDTTGLPFEFGPDKNVLWKTELPFSASSPVLADHVVFVTAHADGKLLTYTPAGGHAQVITLGSFRVDAYAVETGNREWWVNGMGYAPVSGPVVQGAMLYVNVPDQMEFEMPSYEAQLQSFDENQDGRLSREEVQADGFLGEHFGFVDPDLNDFIEPQDYQAAFDAAATETSAWWRFASMARESCRKPISCGDTKRASPTRRPLCSIETCCTS